MSEYLLIATTPTGVEPLLAAELTELGAATPRPVHGGVAFQGPLELAYRACLWSRTASRVLLPLAEFPATDAEALYASIHDLPWEEHLAPDGTLSIEFSGGGPGIDHTHYGAQRVKDAIVDRFRARCGRRPSVDSRQPDLRIHARWRDGQATVSLDLSGDSLHRRGYREATVTAPLKETLAAALLLKVGLAGHRRRWRTFDRPTLWFRHPGDRSRLDRRRPGARTVARILGIQRLAGSHSRRCGTGCWPRHGNVAMPAGRVYRSSGPAIAIRKRCARR